MATQSRIKSKTCFKCGETKPFGDFYKEHNSRDGRRTPCKTCYSQESRRRRARAVLDPKWREKRRADCRAWWTRSGKQYRKDPERMERRRVSMKRYNDKHPKQRAAHGALYNAVRNGGLVKPTHCQRCGEEPLPRDLHAHHHDYTKPLNVEWICLGCHGKEHRIA